jgi:hypothetical protein
MSGEFVLLSMDVVGRASGLPASDIHRCCAVLAITAVETFVATPLFLLKPTADAEALAIMDFIVGVDVASNHN